MNATVKNSVRAILLGIACSVASAQDSQSLDPKSKITPTFRDVELVQVIETVGAATGRNFVIDPRVRGKITMISTQPMSMAAFYEAFLSMLQVNGFSAVTSGGVTKIIPETNAIQFASSADIVTQIVTLQNVSASQMVPVLRPLVPQFGHIAAIPNSNSLIITDRSSNVARMLRIIQRIDQASTSDIEIVALQNAAAADITQTLSALIQNAENSGINQVKIASDVRSNSILISGDRTQRLRVKATIAYLDTPLTSGGNTRVRYLRYADAEKIAARLKEQFASNAFPQNNGTQPERTPTIWAEPETNSLVVTAPSKTMDSIMEVIDRLDIRRAQVLVEAIIVEISEDKSAELGVNWLATNTNPSSTAAGFVEPVGNVSILDLLRAADNPATLTSAPRGLTLGVGRINAGNINFAAMIRAMRGDSDTNIIATPSIVTMDNQEAEIKVTQEIPFITGQYTNSNNTANNVTPFQTIQRQEVGTILRITPQINEGDSIMLRIEQESSSLAGSSRGAVDLITNKRTISTNVMIEDSGIIVLGGLIQDAETRGEQRVPLLGKIPILGEAFRTRSASRNKTNLMVFIQPRILRDEAASRIQTNSKYNYIRGEQDRVNSKFEINPLIRNTGATLPDREKKNE